MSTSQGSSSTELLALLSRPENAGVILDFIRNYDISKLRTPEPVVTTQAEKSQSGARTTSRGASNAPAGTTIYNHIHSQVNGGDNMTVFMNGEAKDQRNAAQRGVDLDPDLSDKDARIVRSLFDELMDKNVNSKNTNSSAPAGNGASSSSSIPAKPDSASLAVDKNQEGQRKSADFNFTWRFDQAVSNPHNKECVHEIVRRCEEHSILPKSPPPLARPQTQSAVPPAANESATEASRMANVEAAALRNRILAAILSVITQRFRYRKEQHHEQQKLPAVVLANVKRNRRNTRKKAMMIRIQLSIDSMLSRNLTDSISDEDKRRLQSILNTKDLQSSDESETEEGEVNAEARALPGQRIFYRRRKSYRTSAFHDLMRRIWSHRTVGTGNQVPLGLRVVSRDASRVCKLTPDMADMLLSDPSVAWAIDRDALIAEVRLNQDETAVGYVEYSPPRCGEPVKREKPKKKAARTIAKKEKPKKRALIPKALGLRSNVLGTVDAAVDDEEPEVSLVTFSSKNNINNSRLGKMFSSSGVGSKSQPNPVDASSSLDASGLEALTQVTRTSSNDRKEDDQEDEGMEEDQSEQEEGEDNDHHPGGENEGQNEGVSTGTPVVSEEPEPGSSVSGNKRRWEGAQQVPSSTAGGALEDGEEENDTDIDLREVAAAESEEEERESGSRKPKRRKSERAPLTARSRSAADRLSDPSTKSKALAMRKRAQLSNAEHQHPQRRLQPPPPPPPTLPSRSRGAKQLQAADQNRSNKTSAGQ